MRSDVKDVEDATEGKYFVLVRKTKLIQISTRSPYTWCKYVPNHFSL